MTGNCKHCELKRKIFERVSDVLDNPGWYDSAEAICIKDLLEYTGLVTEYEDYVNKEDIVWRCNQSER